MPVFSHIALCLLRPHRETARRSHTALGMLLLVDSCGSSKRQKRAIHAEGRTDE